MLMGANFCKQQKRDILAQQLVGHSHPRLETALINVNLRPKKTP